MRLLVALFCVLAICAGPRVLAQEPTPAPTEAPPADPHTYDDAAMHFQAPADFKLLGEHHIQLKDVADPAIVAAWVKQQGDPNERDLYITVEAYSGDASGYELTAENAIRNKIDDAFVDHKEQLTTNNGMPAFFMAISYGSGFDARKQYQLVWSDGQRGVTVALVGPTGELTEKEARAVLLTNVTAVLYPPGRE